MNLRDLKYFVALAEHLHFGRAASICFVSQPSLSIQIKKLETTLGVELIERTSKSVVLTDIGKKIAGQAQQLLQQANNIKEAAKCAQDPFSGKLNLSVIPTLTSYLLPHVLPELTKTETFPKLSIYLAEENSTASITNLKQGKSDVVLLSLPLNDTELSIVPLFQEELMLAVAKYHPLAKKKILKSADLAACNMLLIESQHCLHDQTISICQQFNIPITKHIRATNLEILRYMVAANIGTTIMPRLACQATDGITYIPFQDPISRTIAMAWRKTSPKQLLLAKIADHIQRLLVNKHGIQVLHS